MTNSLSFAKGRRLWLIILILINFASFLLAQNDGIKFEHISIKNGLSQNSGTSIIQDKNGFLWFGTQYGLNRYNGYDFERFLRLEEISVVYEDKFENLWIGTMSNLYKIDEKRTNPETFFGNNEGNQHGQVSFNVLSIKEDLSNNLWIGSNCGLYRYERNKNQISQISFGANGEFNFNHDVIYSVFVDRKGNLWIGTSNRGLFKVSFLENVSTINGGIWKSKFFIEHYKNSSTDPFSISSNDIRTIYEDKESNIWIGTLDGGLNKFIAGESDIGERSINHSVNEKKGKFVHFKNVSGNINSLSHNDVRAIWEDNEGYLWIGTFGGGMNKFDKAGGRFFRFQNDPTDPNSLSSNYILTIYQDKSGTFWVGTYSDGIDKFSKEKSRFIFYKNDQLKTGRKLNNIFITSIFEDVNNVLWIGTKNGLYKFDRYNQRFTYFKHDPQNPNSISDDRVRSICTDKYGRLWFGTYNGGVNVYDERKNKFIHYSVTPNDSNSLSNNTIRTMLLDGDGIMWIGTYGGLNRFDDLTGKFVHYNFSSEYTKSFGNNHIWSLYEDRFRNFWVGTRMGLKKFNKSTGKFVSFFFGNNDDKNTDGIVVSICEDKAGQLWIGTYGHGLFKLKCPLDSLRTENLFLEDKKNYKELVQVPLREDIKDEAITGILCDDNNNLWISTNEGLLKYNPKNNYLRVYDMDDGLQSNEFNTGSFFKNDKGEMFFGGNNGFNRFFPNEFTVNQNIPPVIITSFKKFDKLIKFDRNINDIGRIELTYSDNFFSFEFASLDYIDPMKNQYAYMLEGLDKNWIYCGNRRFASYTNLGSGEYIFRVRGSNNDLVWNNEGVSIKIIISPPFWNTWLFRIFAVISLLAIIFSFYKIRIRTIARQTKNLESLVSARTLELEQRTNQIIQHHETLFKLTKLDLSNYDKSIDIILYECALSLELAAVSLWFYFKDHTTLVCEKIYLSGAGMEKANLRISTEVYPVYLQTAELNQIIISDKPSSCQSGESFTNNLLRSHNIFSTIEIPIRLKGVLVCILRLEHFRPGRTWTQEEQSFAISISDLIAISLESNGRKIAEEALESEKERLAVTLRSIGDGVITTDTKGKIVFINKIAENLTGWNADDAVGRQLFEVFHIIEEKTRKICEDPVERILMANKIIEFSGQTLLITKNGRELMISDSGAPIREKDGKIIGIVLVFRDITEKRRMEEDISKAHKLDSLGVLAGGIAHDFNNLLTAILGNISLAKYQIPQDHKIYNRLIEAEKASVRAKDLAQQLLTFSKGGAPIKKVASVPSLLRDTISFILSGSKIKCEFFIPDDIWSINCDEGQISQVIGNLIINADQAMPEGGKIEIHLENLVIEPSNSLILKSGKYVKILFKDHGIGIPQEHLNKIFDPFYSTKEKGRGLGLTTVYSIIQKHDGFIEVRSEVGIGTSFIIYLPALEEMMNLTDASEDILKMGKGRILILDDDEMILEFAREVIEELGYECMTAKDEIAAIDLYSASLESSNPFDAVILDLTIPGGHGGKEVVKKLKEINSQIVAIVSSGYSTDPIMANYEEYGFKACIPKPYKIYELSRVLDEVINGKNQNK